MSAGPDITVFSCWYNRKEGLEESVRSILDQKDVDFEYIIVDDASTDGSSEMLKKFDDPRLRIIRNEHNIGFVKSANKAVLSGTGRYVAVHDAGDLSMPQRLKKQFDFLEENQNTVAVGVGVESRNLVTGRVYSLKSHEGAKDGLRYAYTHGEVMFRREIYNKVGGYREIFYFSQDKDLWHRLSSFGELGLISEPLYSRIVFEDGVAHDHVKLAQQAVFSNLMMHSATERSKGRPDPVERYNALALLTQPRTARFKTFIRRRMRKLLTRGELRKARETLEAVPVRMLSAGELSLLIVLRAILARR